MLMILAHYKVINDNRSLKLEEYLRRRARLQRVEEAVNRNVVVGFFDTLYWSRQLRRARDGKRAARMTELPNFGVPEIFIHDESDITSPITPKHAIPSLSVTPVDHDPSDTHESLDFTRRASVSGADAGSSQQAATMRQRSGSIHAVPHLSPASTPSGSPTRTSHLSPRHTHSASQHSIQPDWHFAAALERTSPPGSPRLTAESGGSRSRANSAVSQHEMMGVFDSSAWGESMRRSHTMRRASQRRPPS